MGSIGVNGLVALGADGFGGTERRAVFGGPEVDAARMVSGETVTEAAATSPMNNALSANDESSPALRVHEAAFDIPTNPLGSTLFSRGGVFSYRVVRGDTLTKIAYRFGISVDTILWANSRVRSSYLSPGDELLILSVSGVLHEAGAGDTIETIAALYGVPEERIREANAATAFAPGVKLLIPGGRPKQTASVSEANLPRLSGYFTIPVSGWNWGELHSVNAVDIANACGTPVRAAAEGLVSEVGAPSDWNGGYGGFVRVEHSNGTATRYAHLGKVSVAEGDYVEKNKEIGAIGNTGNTHGPTGCHLHFEVEGAKNPFAK